MATPAPAPASSRGRPPKRTAALLAVVVAAAALGPASGFAPAPARAARAPPGGLGMAPRFDKAAGRWSADDPDERAGSSYGPVGTLYRAGPVPFFSRLRDPDAYDQAVLKYMAQAGCGRREAQGNMDAYLENPQDWAYQKVQEQNGGYKKDYADANMEPKQVVLTTVWGVGIVGFLGNLAYTGIQGGIMADSFQRTMELLGVNT